MKRIIKSIIIIALLYVALLFWGDFRKQVFADIDRLLYVMPVLIGLTSLSVLLRFLRWRRLFIRAGIRIPSIWLDFLAYIAGFAFTATPGKVGELIRIRYYQPFNVKPVRVISAFVFERLFDLIAIFILSCLAVARVDLLVIAVLFVASFITITLLMIYKVSMVLTIAGFFERRGYKKLSALCMTVHDSLRECRIWMNPRDIAVNFILALVAWAIAAYSVIYFLDALQLKIPLIQAITIFPLATLVGAASMLPGGVGSAEVAFTVLLTYYGITVAMAAFITVGIRITSLWFSILIGLLALLYLEYAQGHLKDTVSDENEIS